MDLGLFKIGGYVDLGLFKTKGANCAIDRKNKKFYLMYQWESWVWPGQFYGIHKIDGIHRKLWLSFFINKTAKGLSSVYSNTFLCILLVINHSNLIFCQFHIFLFGPIRKSKNAKSPERLRNFNLLYQWWIVVTVHSNGHI